MAKNYISFFLFFFICQLSFGQLSDFNLNVTKTDETCTANATLTFTVSNTTAGATIGYTLYHLPNTTTPISIQNSTTLAGLVAGDYRVVATQSLGGLNNSQQQDVTIVDRTVLLTYKLVGQDEICGGDGTITVTTVTGTAAQYELFSGPVIKPLQSSNVFTGLVAGQYKVRVFDPCSEGVVQTYTLLQSESGAGLTITVASNSIVDCSTSNLLVNISNSSASTQVKYPLNISITVMPPDGSPPVSYNQVILSNSQNFMFSQNIILYANQVYTIKVHVVDGCGKAYDFSLENSDSGVIPKVGVNLIDCQQNYIFVSGAVTAVLIQAPVAFTENLPFVPYKDSNGTYYLYNVPVGTYVFTTTDKCGVVRTQSVTVELPLPNITFFSNPSCTVGQGAIFGMSNLKTVILISAPAAYPNILPYDLTSEIEYGSIILNEVPEGTYVFDVTDNCGNNAVKSVTVVRYIEDSNVVTILPHCGSFDINLQNSSNATAPTFWLQKYDPITKQWGHPVTGQVFTGVGYPTISDSISLNNNTINYNFAFTGTFRILKSSYSFTQCISSIYEFTFTGQPKIDDVYTFSCSNGTYDVIVNATGFSALTYRIVQKNGSPFVIQNGNSSVFLGIAPGHYKFQVEDVCGNILNSEYDVPRPFDFSMAHQGFCNGQAGSLTIPNFPALSYKWWKDTNQNNVLSTTNSLQFPVFNSVTDAGVYHVRVNYSGNPNSCIDFVLDYSISGSNTPSAGQDNAVTYCGSQGQINLNSLLSGTFDGYGLWSEITNSGTLFNNLWNSTTVLPGTYQFKYKVTGLCSFIDEALVSITIKPIPQTPVASVNPIICDANDITLFCATIPNATYQWSGSNGFTSIEQNPIIAAASSANNGNYTVSVSNDGCLSASSSVSVLVDELPEFTIESTCSNSVLTITGLPIQTDASYTWTGPNGYSSTSNPILMPNADKGVYNLTVTSSKGCLATKSIAIVNTLCSISNAITPNGDNINDTFDLSGFDIDNLKIFSRWGRLVYEKDNYTNEWEGQNMNGGYLPDSTYYYFIKFKSGEEKHGWLFMTR